jgi:hypothetical protein
MPTQGLPDRILPLGPALVIEELCSRQRASWREGVGLEASFGQSLYPDMRKESWVCKGVFRPHPQPWQRKPIAVWRQVRKRGMYSAVEGHQGFVAQLGTNPEHTGVSSGDETSCHIAYDMAWLRHASCLRGRAARANLETFDRLLAGAGEETPCPRDEIAESSQ